PKGGGCWSRTSQSECVYAPFGRSPLGAETRLLAGPDAESYVERSSPSAKSAKVPSGSPRAGRDVPLPVGVRERPEANVHQFLRRAKHRLAWNRFGDPQRAGHRSSSTTQDHKGQSASVATALQQEKAVGEAGFEPATTSTQSSCTTGLCDSPKRPHGDRR